MKKILVIFCIMLFSTFIYAGQAAAEEKFAFIELSRLFNEYNKTKDYDQDLAAKEDDYNKEREKKVNEVKQLQDKLSLLSESQRESKMGELEKKIQSLQDFDREKQVDLRKEFNEKREEVLKDIDDTIKQYAKKEGYTFVFNEVGVLYNVKNLDITEQILKELNKGYRKR